MQSLFKSDLISLRDDITVLTYNYDSYLPYLLYRALEKRRYVKQIMRGSGVRYGEDALDREHEQRLNAVTSGLFSQADLSWLKI